MSDNNTTTTSIETNSRAGTIYENATTVRELMEQLSKFDPDRIVVMSGDGEGNDFSPYADAEGDQVYVGYSTWSGEAGPEALTDELKSRGYTDEDIKDGGVPAVVLWPTN